MALSVASGSFLTPTSPDSAFAVTGVGFQGKLLLLWGGRHPTGLGSHANGDAFFGAAASSASRWCMGGSMLDNQGTSSTVRTQNVTSCYRECSPSATIIDIDFVSWDSDGFTLDVATADATASRIFYTVLGGSDLANVAVSNFDFTTDTAYAVTAPGFTPKLLILATSQHFRTSPATEGQQASLMFALGAGIATTARWGGGLSAGSGLASPSSNGVLGAGTILTAIDVLGTTAGSDSNWDFTSFDANGFTVTKTGGNTASRGMLYIALGGTFRVAVNTLLQKTSTGTEAYTGVGFPPEALLLYSGSKTATGAASADGKLSLGVALSTSNRRCSAMADDSNDPSICDSHATESKCIVHLTAGTPTVDAEADLSSFDSDGFTLNWTSADATARRTGYIALASAAAAAPTRKALTLLGVS